MLKSEARKLFQSKRKALTSQDVDELSSKCINLLLENFNVNGKNIAIFSPFKRQNEPNTFLLFNSEEFQNTKFSAPRVVLDDLSMEFYKVNSIKDFLIGAYGILEPISNDIILKSELDIILIPLLCFDYQGFRVGYGKGYYDRYLADAPSSLIKVGISLFEGVNLISDIHDDDIRLDFCITPYRIYKF